MELSLDDFVRINEQIKRILRTPPNPRIYAEVWLGKSPDEIELPSNLIPVDGHLPDFINRLPQELKRRNEPGLLFLRLFQTKTAFMPYVCAEAGIIEADMDFNLKQYISKPDVRMRELKKDILAYERVIQRSIDTHTINYISAMLDSCKSIYDAGVIEITRSQYASLVMLLAKDPLAASIISSYVIKLSIGRPSTHYLQTLCCIVYYLLLEHAKRIIPKQSNKAYCRGLAAQVVNALLPKNKNGGPATKSGKPVFDVINERDVELAVTGK